MEAKTETKVCTAEESEFLKNCQNFKMTGIFSHFYVIPNTYLVSPDTFCDSLKLISYLMTI